MKKSAKTFIVILGAIVFFASLNSAQSLRDRRDQPEKLFDIAGVKSGMSVG